jgi:hypothetical protein
VPSNNNPWLSEDDCVLGVKALAPLEDNMLGSSGIKIFLNYVFHLHFSCMPSRLAGVGIETFSDCSSILTSEFIFTFGAWVQLDSLQPHM